MSYASESIKTAARAVLDSLTDNASWDDVQYHLYVRQQIDAGPRDDSADRLISTDEMRRLLAAHKSNAARTEN